MTTHKVIIGDSRKVELNQESVHLIITSPPYFNIKDYGNHNQIGYNNTYKEYITNLNLIWKNCYSVLYPGCKMCVNIGDQYNRTATYGRYSVIPIRTEIIQYCLTLGFDYQGAIIWQKATNLNTTGGAIIMGSYPYPRNGIIKLDYEFILIFKKLGIAPKIGKIKKRRSKLTILEWNNYFKGHWNFPGVKHKGHSAMFPIELPRRLIKMYSFVGDTILDPFLGSGTTMQAARELGRNSIGIELNKKFLPLIEKKIGGLFCSDKIKIIESKEE